MATLLPVALDIDSAYESRAPTGTLTSRDTSDDDGIVSHTSNSKKRRRVADVPDDPDDEPADTIYLDALDEEDEPIDLEIDGAEDDFTPPGGSPQPNLRIEGIQIVPPPLVHPKSQYQGHPLKQRLSEVEILEEFMARDPEPQEDGSIYFRLDKFSVYNAASHKRRAYEMIPLSALNVAKATEFFMVDGILTDGVTEHYIEGMPVDSLSIEYPTDGEIATQCVWMQSMLNFRSSTRHRHSKREKHIEGAERIWYSLGTPAPEYERYHTPFMWLAGFSRYFVQYAEEVLDVEDGGSGHVDLWCFKKDFAEWVRRTQNAKEWMSQYPSDDYRVAVACHVDWLANQVYGVTDHRSKLRAMQIWRDVRDYTAIEPAAGAPIEQTVVTPYVYDCFEPLFTTKLMKVRPGGEEESPKKTLIPMVVIETPAKKTAVAKTPVVDVIDLDPPPEATEELSTQRTRNNVDEPKFIYENPKIGDVVAFEPDAGTPWKGDSHDYGYVTKVYPDRVNIIWLYKPNHTVLFSGNSKYPHDNELFFSNHCNCADKDIPALIRDVVGLPKVNFFGQPGSDDCFVRMKYETVKAGFVSLTKEDLRRCCCADASDDPFTAVRTKYTIGDPVLVIRDQTRVDPYVIEKFDDDEGKIALRVLERRVELGVKEAPANELVYTQRFISVKPRRIERHCHVRVFSEGEKVVTPYDRNGKGDCFFIRMEEVDGAVVPLKGVPEKLRQGFLLGAEAPAPPQPVLKGLDLFCGGGNFGRGIEEGGAVEMKYAVDIVSKPLHTYRANLRHPDNAALYLGSINNYLKDAITGKYSKTVAPPEEVDFISAGSPCQGFSLANGNRNSERSIQNCSLVSSLATAIDIYRPKYALLENVHQLGSARRRADNTEYNVFSTLLCCIVGMGYQCQQFILDSWSYGDPQSRTRLFLAVSAPGLQPLRRPPRTHDHTHRRALSLWEAPNGERFAEREVFGPTPFKHTTSFQTMDHLPRIFDDHVGLCISHPDHRTSRDEGPTTVRADKLTPYHSPAEPNTRRLLLYIPRFPECQGWRQGVDRDMLTENLRIYPKDHGEKAGKRSKAWMRIRKHGLCRTITTQITPQCSRTGTYVHYDQPRLISIQEARIAQGFPEDEVLVGKPADRFKVVGNSVARGVSMALGVALRKAWFREWED